jgi:hypothetical protein
LVLLSLALLIGIGLVGFVYKKSHSILRENIEDEAEEARETLMPGANGVGVTDYGAIGSPNGGTRTPDSERGRGRSLA